MQTLVLPKHQVAKLESVVGKDWIYGEVPVNGTDKFTVTDIETSVSSRRPYVRIRAYHDRPSFAADALLRAIGEQQEGGER